MTVTADRILKEPDLSAMVALDNFDAIAERIRNLMSHRRRVTLVDRFLHDDRPPRVTAGLTLDRFDEWSNSGGKGFEVWLKPGALVRFGISAYAGENDTERQEQKRFDAGKATSDRWAERRTDMTEVTVSGGLPESGPLGTDRLVIRRWNSDGVCAEYVVAFDGGPRDGEYRAGRWLYGMALGPAHMEDQLRAWDMGKVPDADVELWAGRAKELLAVVADEGR